MFLPKPYDPFPLRIEYESKVLFGKVTPWKIPRDSVIPTRFMIYFDDIFRGNIICRDGEWVEFNGNMGGQGLVDTIGEYIMNWYE